MKKIAVLLIIVSMTIFASPRSKGVNTNLRKNNKISGQNNKKNETSQETWNRIKPEIKIRLDKLSKETIAGNYKQSFDEMPDKILKYLANKFSISTAKAKNLIVEMMSKMAKELKIVENSYDLENVRLGKTGIGRNYIIIPMKVTALYNGKKLTNTGEIMVFEDEGKWYIINYDKDQMILLKDVYPDLVKIKEK